MDWTENIQQWTENTLFAWILLKFSPSFFLLFFLNSPAEFSCLFTKERMNHSREFLFNKSLLRHGLTLFHSLASVSIIHTTKSLWGALSFKSFHRKLCLFSGGLIFLHAWLNYRNFPISHGQFHLTEVKSWKPPGFKQMVCWLDNADNQ